MSCHGSTSVNKSFHRTFFLSFFCTITLPLQVTSTRLHDLSILSNFLLYFNIQNAFQRWYVYFFPLLPCFLEAGYGHVTEIVKRRMPLNGDDEADWFEIWHIDTAGRGESDDGWGYHRSLLARLLSSALNRHQERSAGSFGNATTAHLHPSLSSSFFRQLLQLPKLPMPQSQSFSTVARPRCFNAPSCV